MNMDDSRLIASFQLLITEMLIEKRLGQRRPGLTDELYQTWLEVEQRGLKKTPEYETCCWGQIGTLCGSQDCSATQMLRHPSLQKK
jgi:hypothetical protein